MSTLILLRHGQSVWNLENLFTGSVDVDLTPQGIEEARMAGLLLKNIEMDIAFTSVLKRAVHTLQIILETTGAKSLPVVQSAALNERYYGDLQGMNKSEAEARFGKDQVLLWRRSFEVAPPNGESLKNTYDRVIPFYQKNILTDLRKNKNILVVAHGNSLRALIMYLEDISVDKIAELSLATGSPRIYDFDNAGRISEIKQL